MTQAEERETERIRDNDGLAWLLAGREGRRGTVKAAYVV